MFHSTLDPRYHVTLTTQQYTQSHTINHTTRFHTSPLRTQDFSCDIFFLRHFQSWEFASGILAFYGQIVWEMSRANEKGHRYIFLNVTEKYNRQLQTFDELSWVSSKNVTGNYDHSARISIKQPKAPDKNVFQNCHGILFFQGQSLWFLWRRLFLRGNVWDFFHGHDKNSHKHYLGTTFLWISLCIKGTLALFSKV